MAALAPSSHVGRKEYEVFISFRGSDVRNGFLSHLTKQLRQEGIDVYVDERLERGDEISSALVEAIERSIIALVIFSEDYASSRWCLEELVKIMECKQVKNQIVVPVFYNVDPSHVRHQEGSYADAFTQHEQKFKDDLKKLQVWRSVLKETADLSGYHSSNFLNDSDLIDGIIKDVLRKLEDKDIIEPTKLIGFEENLATIESFIKVDSQEVGVLGIWGKGGIGKTALTRAIFDKFSHQFDCSCFVSSVREEVKKIGLTSLLEKVLSILLNDKNVIMRRRPNTQRRLRRTRVLLVLDDVDTSSQLHYLIEENLSMGPSSKVIITSRDRHVFVSGGVHVIHEVKELNMEESLELFCRHAFKQAYPEMGYEKLSAQAIQYARGLPLALKVLGSHLNSKSIKSWESALKRLRKYPDAEILTVLRVSYDGLNIPEKRIFLDIAFFFRGDKKEDITKVLDACDDFYADCGIDSLLDKALITISRDNKVEIHDLLREMAEDIVREESTQHPERRSRLNDVKEIQDVLESNKDLMNLKIINLSFSRDLEEFPDLSMAQHLEIVDLAYCENLRRIHPSILSLPKLVCLNLRSCRKLENLHGKNHLKSLKHLTLARCYSLKKFSLSSVEMTSLDLVETGIETLNLPIGHFNKLEELYLGWNLRSFQINELSCLTSLKIFSLSEFTGGIGKSKLVILFDAWRCLEELHLRDCEVSEIPDNISVLSSLKILSLRGSKVKILPNTMKHLSELKQIDLGHCNKLRSLPELPPSITRFYADECTSLETFNFSPMQAIYNKSCEVRVCYPGSIIPKGFKYCQMGKSSITIELAPPSSSSDHLLGFASCCILSALEINTSAVASVCRRFHFENEEINNEDEKQFPGLWILNRDHVYVWYDPMEHILKETQRRRFENGTTCKFACEFFIGYFFDSEVARYDHRIKGCGICPIYASGLQETVQQMELKLENGTETEMPESFNRYVQRNCTALRTKSSGNENPNAEMAQHHPARDSVGRSTPVRQRTWNLCWRPCFKRNA